MIDNPIKEPEYDFHTRCCPRAGNHPDHGRRKCGRGRLRRSPREPLNTTSAHRSYWSQVSWRTRRSYCCSDTSSVARSKRRRSDAAIRIRPVAGTGSAMAVAEDLDKGITDRLKSLPVARLALLGGRALGELAIIAWGIVVTAGLGFLVGFRLHGSAQEALLAIVVGLVCGFAFLWLFICLGLASGNAQAAQGIGFMIYPFMFISSAYIPVYTLPNWMQPLRREPARQRHGQTRCGHSRSVVPPSPASTTGPPTG